jgi:phytanoyl-CoA hydroxylase
MKTTLSPSDLDTYPLTDEQITTYRRDGFLALEGVFAGEQLAELRDAVAGAVEMETKLYDVDADGRPRPKGVYGSIFNQKVNLWRRHPRIARYALSKRLGNLAARLEGVPMRMWHDQALFKEPMTGNNKTPWHQDAVYWPHVDRSKQTTIWIALKDATIENGCMAFVGGTHKIGPVPAVDLSDPQDIFQYAPHIKPVKPRVIELKAGSATFHNGLTFHYAGPNKSNSMREAFAIIYMPDSTTFNGAPHVVLNGTHYAKGDVFDGELFPIVSDPM